MFQTEFLPYAPDELLEIGESMYESYKQANPFPYVCLDHFFNHNALKKVLGEFPDLDRTIDIIYKNPNEDKFASRGEYRFGEATRAFVHFLNSQPFLEFLSRLTGIEGLLPDPYLWGGGFHQIKPGGFLKVHADFNKHPVLNLDRRLNLLVYLNEDWSEAYGGNFELWNKDMSSCEVRLQPLFNRMVIFNTTDTSFHGHPDPLTCPENRSRKSLALYYYTNGRPANEVSHSRIATDFRSRKGLDSGEMKRYNHFINFITSVTPKRILKYYKKVMGA